MADDAGADVEAKMNEMSMGDDPNAMFAGAKKKKKKKKESDLEDMGEAAPAPSGDAPAGDDAGADDLGSFDLSMMKKKKKKKKAVDVDGLDEGAEEEDGGLSPPSWLGSPSSARPHGLACLLRGL
mmetsp:Transcript_29280/g.93690  ORF Transcript_29280/g.93690 Transcript_29280/m.93690 type:complete len:125 (+) Transcript_29280:33-407(+)